MCTFNRVLFQNWSIPQYALLSHYSTSSCQMHIWRIESISDNNFNSLTLHFSSRSAYRWVQILISSRSCRLHESRLYDPCSPLCFHYISACAQFARTDSCLLLCRRQSENIEPARSTMRLQRQHNSDSSKKCSMGRVLVPLSIFHQIFAVKTERLVSMVIYWYPMVPHLILRYRILNMTEWLIMTTLSLERACIDWNYEM